MEPARPGKVQEQEEAWGNVRVKLIMLTIVRLTKDWEEAEDWDLAEIEMPRPKIKRCLRFNPEVLYFKPRGVPLSQLEEVELLPDELEALKLHDVDNLDQISASQNMKVSQPTFGRILDKAYKKIAIAIIKGKTIKIKT